MKTALLVCLCSLLALAIPALRADPEPWQAGRFDGQITDAINATCKTLPLRETKLKNVLPQYWVEIDPALTWQEALKAAAAKFPDDQVKRILFLARYLEENDSVDRIEEMHMPAGIQGINITGSSAVTSHDIGGGWEKAPDNVIPVNDTERRFPIYRPSLLQLVVSHAHQDRRIRACSIQLNNQTIDGITYESLHFGMDGTLQGFERRLKIDGTALTLSIGGNTSGEGGQDFYYGSVHTGEQRITLENIHLSPARVITRRSVYQAFPHVLYRETYREGKLTKRSWYKTMTTDTGTQSVIDRTETFE